MDIHSLLGRGLSGIPGLSLGLGASDCISTARATFPMCCCAVGKETLHMRPGFLLLILLGNLPSEWERCHCCPRIAANGALGQARSSSHPGWDLLSAHHAAPALPCRVNTSCSLRYTRKVEVFILDLMLKASSMHHQLLPGAPQARGRKCLG